MITTWLSRKIGEVCELVRGTEPGRENYFEEPTKNTIRFIRVGDLSGKMDNPKFVSNELDNLVLVKPEEILISFDGTPGVVSKGWDGAIASGIRVIRHIKPEILKSFLFYHLQTRPVQEVIKFYTTGVTILHGSRAIPHIEIHLPPLPIQRKIVQRLDAIRKAQELNDKQIALADELFHSLLQRELKPQKSWERKRIKEVVYNITYGISISVVANLEPVKGVPIITMADVTDDGQIDYNKVRKIRLDASDIDKFQLEKGDVLFNWRNASKDFIGKTAVFENDIKATYASFLLKIKCKPLLNNHYLYYYLHHLRKIGFFREKCKFSANNTINASELKQIYILLAPITAQRQIVEKLQAVQDYKKKLLEQKQKLQELLESCLDKAMKGELLS